MAMEQQPPQPHSQDHSALLCAVRNMRQLAKLLCEQAAEVREQAEALVRWSKLARQWFK